MDETIFKIKQVLAMIETKLQEDSNSCEFGYYKKLKEELLKELNG